MNCRSWLRMACWSVPAAVKHGCLGILARQRGSAGTQFPRKSHHNCNGIRENHTPMLCPLFANACTGDTLSSRFIYTRPVVHAHHSGFVSVHHAKAGLSVYNRKLYRHRLENHGGGESDTGFGDGCEDGREGAAHGGTTCPAGGLREAYDTGGTEGEGRGGGRLSKLEVNEELKQVVRIGKAVEGETREESEGGNCTATEMTEHCVRILGHQMCVVPWGRDYTVFLVRGAADPSRSGLLQGTSSIYILASLELP